MVKSKFTPFVGVPMFFSTLLCGTQVSAQGGMESPVLVTATRTAQIADETLSSVTVITDEDIRQRQARSVADVLRNEVGLQVVSSGGRGAATSYFMRGAESDHILVLIDGIKVGSATLGVTQLQDIPVELIERIEIVRGPRSSLYGSEAVAGVIQVFTYKGADTLTPSLTLGAGTDNFFKASAGLRGGVDSLFYNLSISGEKTDGIDSCRSSAATNFTACFTDESDDDGYENLAGSLRVGLALENGSELSFNALHSESEAEFDGSFQNESESVQQVFGLNANIALSQEWLVKFNWGQSKDYSDNFLNGQKVSNFETTRETSSIQNDITLFDENTLTIGADFQSDEIESTANYAETERQNLGGFIQYLGTTDYLDYDVNLRHDDYDQFGSEITGSLGIGMNLSDSLRMIASYGTGFKAPTFNELYYPGFGNSELKPEETRAFEIGMRGRYASTAWSITWFNTLIDELIGFDSSFSPVNIDQARVKGVEFDVDSHIGENWKLGANFTWQDPKNESALNDGNQLVRRSKRSGRVDLDFIQNTWSVGVAVIAAGKSYDDLANTRELGAYQLVDLRGQVELHQDWLLQLRVENLFDQDYETSSDYNQPGLGAYLTLRFLPKKS